MAWQEKGGIIEDFGDSDNEAEPDAYLARVKAEAEERDSGSDGSDDESTDDDFNPDAEKVEDVADEYDRYVLSPFFRSRPWPNAAKL